MFQQHLLDFCHKFCIVKMVLETRLFYVICDEIELNQTTGCCGQQSTHLPCIKF